MHAVALASFNVNLLYVGLSVLCAPLTLYACERHTRERNAETGSLLLVWLIQPGMGWDSGGGGLLVGGGGRVGGLGCRADRSPAAGGSAGEHCRALRNLSWLPSKLHTHKQNSTHGGSIRSSNNCFRQMYWLEKIVEGMRVAWFNSSLWSSYRVIHHLKLHTR